MPYPSIPARAESQPWGCLPLPCLLRVQVPRDPCQLSDPPPEALGSPQAVRSSRLPSLLWTPRICYMFLVKCVVLLIYRALVAGGLAEEPHGKLHFACADLSARSLQCVYLSEHHTQLSLAALPNAVWRLGSEGQMFGQRK